MMSRAVVLIAATLLLAACGGGSGAGPAPVSGPYAGASGGLNSGGYGR